MDAVQFSLLVFGLIFCVSIQYAEGGMCYKCNSARKYEGAKCEDPEKYKKELLKDCGNVTTNYCRHIVQNVDGDSRIVRDCATIVRPDGFKCVQRTGTKKVKITYCECEGDGCNSANINIITPLALALASLMAFLTMKFSS